MKTPRRRTFSRSVSWTVHSLESRLMLAGDGAAAVAQFAAAPAQTATVAAEATDVTRAAPVTDVVLVDAEVDSADELTRLIGDGVRIVRIDADSDPIAQITAALQDHRDLAAIHVLSHGDSGQVRLGGVTLDASMLDRNAQSLTRWGQSLRAGGDLLIYGCQSASGEAGERLLSTIARWTGADVAGSTDATGASRLGGDWILEASTGVIDSSPLAAVSTLDRWSGLLPITIRAAGSTGQESMQLQIDGAVVQTFNNIGGDPEARSFQTFTYAGGDGVTADRVRVVFTNDVWEPAQNIDRNLRVDSITVNGVTVQSEDPSVFGTGSWLPADGIQPGFRRSEWINSNGYFQYANPAATGSRVVIFAAGNENTETMELWLKGTRAATWTNIGGNAENRQFVSFSFNAAQTITPDDVQIRFTNDLYVNNGEVDRNLRVDRIEIDGVAYQTEAPNVYSTGTWQDGVITPGFKQDETLNTSGLFQFGTVRQAGTISLETSNVAVGEGDGNARINVVRRGGSDGVITVDFETLAGTATPGSDYTTRRGTLTFAEGQTSAQIVVPIIDDQINESTETFSVAIDNVTGGAALLVPRTATVSVSDNEVPLPNYTNFASVAGLRLNGNATASGNALQLTPDAANQAGSAFYTTPISLAGNSSFRTEFSVELTGGSGGADGLTFTIQNDPRGAAALGAGGGGLGYQGITRSVAVELDTYRNATGDVNGNHVAIVQGNVTAPLRTAIPGQDLNSGSRIYVWVDYNGTSDVLAVYLSATPTRPTQALLKTTIDLSTAVGNTALFGFTAGTGGLTNTQRVLSWRMDRSVPPLDPPTQIGDEVAAVNLIGGLNRPTAIEWMPDGTMLIAQQNGVVRTAVGNVLQSTPFIDISRIVNGTRDRGLLDIAVHPDFANNPYVYLLFTYDPPEVFNQAAGTLAGPDGNGNRAGRLIRVTADAATNFRTAVAGSEVVLLGTNSTWANFNGFANSTIDFNEPQAGKNADGTYLRDFINSDSESHTVGSLAFANDGSLFVSIGDGASYNRVDVRADRVQDIDSLSGKILRIDPLTGRGLSSNPFFNGNADANRSKVYQLGLRNPFRISVDPVTGQLYVGDVGWTNWEEINAAPAGANFGWPYYEGGSGTSLVNTRYRDTPEGAAFFARNVAVTAPDYALNHAADGINAIVIGDVLRSDYYGAGTRGDLFFNDLGQGIVRHASLDAAGNVTDVTNFATGANVVVAMRQGPEGAMYFVDLDDNLIGRWELV